MTAALVTAGDPPVWAWLIAALAYVCAIARWGRGRD